ncbi:E3 ubiquitin-protein ligase FANCL isoform X1 [Trichoplusia ni]|uniref:E3 ubiquitin-protein ligase FANCL isoform X1 n=1 Tax=Trichoplusia ni TaxID=7111 RepID=A0A7E5VSW5_TRINI|nr:E3 ubiquitin-protein ligase FANCL isoform X1 [Trichoplusia ni]
MFVEEFICSITKKAPNDVFFLFESLNNLLQNSTEQVNAVTADLIDLELLHEIETIVKNGNTSVYFGKTLRDLKLMIEDEEFRKHEMFIQYKSPKKLIILSANLPLSSMQNLEFGCINEIIEIFKQHVNDLAKYFYELDNIDQCCTVMEPQNATYKDEYRRIFLDDRTWLHIEVTLEGLGTNIHLVGQSEYWNNKLQSGLLNWDHDKNIVDNIITIFDISQFPEPTSTVPGHLCSEADGAKLTTIVCGICLCTDLPEIPGLPLPLCQNSSCGVYYHRSCLYEWLVACAGNRPPAFGVATGACPTCLQPITCSKTDS